VTTRAKFEVDGSGAAKKRSLSGDRPAPWKIALAVVLLAGAGFLIYWNTRPAEPATIPPDQQQEVDRLQQGMANDEQTKKIMQIPESPPNTTDPPGSRARKAPGT
jgi:hypothetical protein